MKSISTGVPAWIGMLMLSAIILLLPSLERHLSLLLFLAFIPLLDWQQSYVQRTNRISLSITASFLALFLWQSLDFTWLARMGWGKVFLISFSNSLIFTLPFVLRALFLRWQRPVLSNLIWLCAWIGLEFLHTKWSLGFPLFQLGNFFAAWPGLIQWYEITGVLGGSLWILVVNLVLLKAWGSKAIPRRKRLLYVAAVLLIPLTVSLLFYANFREQPRNVEVISLHPNTDCYSEKFVLPQRQLIETYLAETERDLGPNTQFVLWPETAIARGQWIDNLDTDPEINLIKLLLARHPHLNFISGINTYAPVATKPGKGTSLQTSYIGKSETTYLSYNAVIQMVSQQPIQLRTKSRLVPFEESRKLPTILKPVQRWIDSASGREYSILKQNPSTQLASDGSTRSGTLICYESAFGSVSAEMSRKGAAILFVLLNEGWYDHWRGAQKFLDLSILRAIETRKSVVRSSNRGVSAAISPTGEVLESFNKRQASTLKVLVSLNKDRTFYARFGDWVAYLCLFLGILCFPFALIKSENQTSKSDT